MNRIVLVYLTTIMCIGMSANALDDSAVLCPLPGQKYVEISYPTPNIDEKKINDVNGVILHHTAESSVERSLEILTGSERGVGTHCVIDTDGTRYIMCEPTVVTFHAGPSILDGRESCNEFCVGIEFQGNTLEKPLTDDQIASAIEYLIPIIEDYRIPISHIVTHQMVREAYKRKYPQKKAHNKADITPKEYARFMAALKSELGIDDDEEPMDSPE